MDIECIKYLQTGIMSIKTGRLTCLKFQVVPKRNFGTEQWLQTLNVILYQFLLLFLFDSLVC